MATTNIAQLKQTSKMVARNAGFSSVKAFFESQKAAVADVLPKHVSPDRMLRIALGALRTTPKLMDCSVKSLMGAVVHCSQLGLEPNTPLGHAYLIPFENRNKGITEVQIVLGYKGLVDLARRSGQIVSIAAHEVCENDHFEYTYGLNEDLVHKPTLKIRGEIIAFYAVAKLQGGGHAFEVMSAEQINEIRDSSQGWKTAQRYNKTATSPWGAHYAEMGRKTVLRRLVKYLPVSIELAQAATLDEASSAGRSQALDNVLEGDYITPAADDDEAIDQDTGEVTSASQGGQPESIAYDYQSLLSNIQKAPGLEELDLVGDRLRDLPEGDDYVKLQAAYTERRAALSTE